MEEIGEIIEINEDKVKLAIDYKKKCDSCNICGGLSGSSKKFIEIENKTDEELHIGDLVCFGIEEKKSVLASFIVYILPLIFSILGYFLGVSLFPDEKFIINGENIAGIICAIITLIITFIVIFLLKKRFAKSFSIKILNKIEQKGNNIS